MLAILTWIPSLWTHADPLLDAATNGAGRTAPSSIADLRDNTRCATAAGVGTG